MIEAAERDGLIEPGRTTIVEATSGNTGIALALVCAAKGYELIVTLPQGMSRERTSLLRQYGARVEIVESLGGMSEAVDAAPSWRDRMTSICPPVLEPANPQIHRETTGPEISRRSTGASTRLSPASYRRHDHRCRRVLRSRNSGCKIVAVEPAASAVLSAARPVRTTSRDWRRLRSGGAESRADRRGDPVGDDRAMQVARLAAQREGIIAGSRAALRSPPRWSSAHGPSGRFADRRDPADSGERYISLPFFAAYEPAPARLVSNLARAFTSADEAGGASECSKICRC